MCLQYIQTHANHINRKERAQRQKQRQRIRKKQQQTMSTRTRNDNDSEGDIKTILWRTIVSPRKMCAQTQAPSTE